MAERAIIFSGSMVKAILDGTKTQTRRALKRPTDHFHASYVVPRFEGSEIVWSDGSERPFAVCRARLPYAPGDVLWVRETWAMVPYSAYARSPGVQMTAHGGTYEAAIYRAGFDRSQGGIVWRPSIHMPRWASRIRLRVTHVKVERLQEISAADIYSEGTPDAFDAWGKHSCRVACGNAYRKLWDSINGRRRGCSWADNPWVAAITFERIE